MLYSVSPCSVVARQGGRHRRAVHNYRLTGRVTWLSRWRVCSGVIDLLLLLLLLLLPPPVLLGAGCGARQRAGPRSGRGAASGAAVTKLLHALVDH